MKFAAAGALALCTASAFALPSFEAVRAAHAPSDLPLLARDGTPLSVVRVDSRVRRGPWLTLADISPALRQAIVYSEDRRFWEHGGVDWRAVAASTWANAWVDRRPSWAAMCSMVARTRRKLRSPSSGRNRSTARSPRRPWGTWGW